MVALGGPSGHPPGPPALPAAVRAQASKSLEGGWGATHRSTLAFPRQLPMPMLVVAGRKPPPPSRPQPRAWSRRGPAWGHSRRDCQLLLHPPLQHLRRPLRRRLRRLGEVGRRASAGAGVGAAGGRTRGGRRSVRATAGSGRQGRAAAASRRGKGRPSWRRTASGDRSRGRGAMGESRRAIHNVETQHPFPSKLPFALIALSVLLPPHHSTHSPHTHASELRRSPR